MSNKALPVGGSRSENAQAENDWIQLAGRACLSALFVFHVHKISLHLLTAGSGSWDAPHVLLAECVLALLVFGLTALLVVGLRSRYCALLLAAVTAAAALHNHPWFVVLWSEQQTYKLDDVIGYENVQVPAWVYATHQRYFFFQQLSTAGALLQLVAHGPGRLSVDEANGPLQVVTLTAKGAE